MEFLADCGAAVPPRVTLFSLELQDVASPHRSTVKRRLERLTQHELVKEVNDSGYYIISKKDRQFLDGKLDGTEL